MVDDVEGGRNEWIEILIYMAKATGGDACMDGLGLG